MNARAGSGWQTALADLSLILFMATAAAVGQAPPAAPAPPVAMPALGEPVAVWRAGPGAPPLGQWLTAAGQDPQLRLTIRAPVSQAQAALALAGTAGRPARIVLEGEGDGPVLATLTYDRMARPLQGKAAHHSLPEAP